MVMEVITSVLGKLGGTSKNDAFPAIKRQVEDLLANTDEFVQQYKRGGIGMSSEERQLLVKQVDINLLALEDLLASISVEETPTNQNIVPDSKRVFLATVRSKMNVMKHAVHPPPTVEFKKGASRAEKTFSPMSVKSQLLQPTKVPSDDVSTRKNFIPDYTPNYDSERGELSAMIQKQQKMMDDQDEMLDSLLPTVMQLRHISEAIHSELTLQNKMLDDMEVKVDKANLALNKTNKKLATLRKQI